MKKSDIAKALWDVIVAAYHQQGRTKVELPVSDVLHILASLMANVLSQVASPMDRERMLRDLAPQIDRMVGSVREKPSIHIPSKTPLVLPS